MLFNKNARIVGDKVILVPYREEHVLKYHEWMKSVELQELTASTPLTLEEEYEMQKSWMLDPSKCTFIILDKEKFESSQCEISSMIGDTNLFFLSTEDALVAEAEIMIAEVCARGKHCGWEAILIMLCYGVVKLNVKQYVVKITRNNVASLNMFRRIGFIETSVSEIFNEVTMEKIVDQDFKSWLMSQLKYEVQQEINK